MPAVETKRMQTKFDEAGYNCEVSQVGSDEDVLKGYHTTPGVGVYVSPEGKIRYAVRVLATVSRKELAKAVGVKIESWMLDFDNGPHYPRKMIIWFHEK